MVEDDAGEFIAYLELDDALELYAVIIGGTAAQAEDHLRNRPGLEGTLARPETYAHYEDADIALQAAVLAHGIAESQCFIDGHKRLALVAMITFLEINGYGVDASDPEFADWIIGLSSGTTPNAWQRSSANACGRARELGFRHQPRTGA